MPGIATYLCDAYGTLTLRSSRMASAEMGAAGLELEYTATHDLVYYRG